MANKLTHNDYDKIKNETVTIAVYDGLSKIKTVCDLNYREAMLVALMETGNGTGRSVRVYRNGSVEACMALMFGK
jgi:hypothetical protein